MFAAIEWEGYKDQPCGGTWTCRICTKEGILLSLSTEIFIGFGQCKECCRWKMGAVPAMIQCSWLALPKASHVLAQLVCVTTNILLNISPAKIQLQPKIHFLIFCAVLLLSFHCLLFLVPSPLATPPPPQKKKEKGGFVCVWEEVFNFLQWQIPRDWAANPEGCEDFSSLLLFLLGLHCFSHSEIVA